MLRCHVPVFFGATALVCTQQEKKHVPVVLFSLQGIANPSLCFFSPMHAIRIGVMAASLVPALLSVPYFVWTYVLIGRLARRAFAPPQRACVFPACVPLCLQLHVSRPAPCPCLLHLTFPVPPHALLGPVRSFSGSVAIHASDDVERPGV